jgi:hypothetical protein
MSHDALLLAPRHPAALDNANTPDDVMAARAALAERGAA